MTPPNLPSLPGLTWSRHKKPGFSTRVASHVSGREVRLPLMSYPLYEFEASYSGLSSASSPPAAQAGLGTSSLQNLMGFFLQLMGQAGVFLYTDPDDNAVAAQSIGVGDGVTQSFVMGRTLGGFNEPVSYVTAIDNVYLNGVNQGAAGTGWQFTSPNMLAFATAPSSGVAVTADFTFAFQCRFLDDQLDFEEFMSALWKLDKLSFRSIKANSSAAGAAIPAWYSLYAIGGDNPLIFADTTTEGTTNRYLYNGTQYGSFSALLSALSGTFSRSSPAYYTNSSGLLVSASSGLLRFDHDNSGNPQGILLEGPSASLAQYSNAPSNAVWNTGGAQTHIALSTPSSPASDGTSSATTVAVNSSGSLSLPGLQQGPISVVNGGTYTWSARLRYNATQYAGVFVYNGAAYEFAVFDIKNGAVGYADTGVIGRISSAVDAEGFWLCQMTVTMAGTGAYIGLSPRSSNAGGTSMTYAGGEKFDVCFMQFENQPFATSYIQTTSGSASRSADSLYLPWTATAFTARVKAVLALEVDGNALLDTGHGLLTQAAGPKTQTSNGTNSINTSITAFAQSNIIVVGGSSAGRVLSANGNAASSDSNALVPSAPTGFYIGQKSSGGGQSNGNYAQFGLWNVAPTVDQAAALSTVA